MSKYIFYLFLFITSIGYAQSTYVHYPTNVEAPLTHQEQQQLEEVFGQDATYVMERPSLLKDLKDLLRNRVRIQEIPFTKAQGSEAFRNAIDLTTVPLYKAFNPAVQHDLSYSKQNFNILKYKIGFFPDEKTIYKLGDYYISVLPQAKHKR